MSILRKYIGNDQIAGEKILLDNEQTLRAKTSAGAAEDLLKLDSSGTLQLLKLPQVSADPSNSNDLVRLSFLTSELDGIESTVLAEQIRAQGAESALQLAIDSKISSSEIGTSVAPIVGGVIPSQYIPSIAITDVFVVANTPLRDGLVTSGAVEKGDIVKVTDSGKTFIYDGSTFIEITADSAVDSVNGQTGHVVLSFSTSEVAETGDSRYFTAAREQALTDLVNQTATQLTTAYTAADASTLSSANAYTDAAVDNFDYTPLILRDGSQPMLGNLDLGSKRIVNVASPEAASDATPKSYADSIRFDLEAQVSSSVQSLSSADSAIRGEFAAADLIVTSAFQAEDSAIRGEFAAADLAIRADIDTQFLNFMKLDGSTPMTGHLNMNLKDITNAYNVYANALTSSSVFTSQITTDEAKTGVLNVWASAETQSGSIQSVSDSMLVSASNVLILDGAYIDTNQKQIKSVAAPTDAQDVTNKSYVDALSVASPAYESKELTAQDIVNGYIDLESTPLTAPIIVRQGLVGRYGDNATKRDFTFSGSRITFVNEWAVGGLAEIEEGDLVEVRYEKSVTPYLN